MRNPEIRQVIWHLMDRTGKVFYPNKQNVRRPILELLEHGYSVDDLKNKIDECVKAGKDVTPETLRKELVNGLQQQDYLRR